MGALRIERDEGLLRITLARPETRNAFDAAMIAELSEAFVDVGTARAVLLAGDGPSFCAGADVEWMRGSVDLDQALHITRSHSGFVVSYAIADVAAFVTAGDPVDLEAHRRGMTLYAPDGRTPLHPPAKILTTS